MIKNLVFDLGNVLVEFKPKNYLKRLNFSEDDIETLTNLIFKDKRWNEFDKGTITLAKYILELKSEHPELSNKFDMVFDKNWPSYFFKPKTECINFLIEASKKYNIYVLSNVSEEVLNYIKNLNFFQYVTSGTYSYLIHSCKPEEKIYKTFLSTNNLNASECLFLDDLPANINSAKKLGMHGIVFKDNIEDIKIFLSKHSS